MAAPIKFICTTFALVLLCTWSSAAPLTLTEREATSSTSEDAILQRLRTGISALQTFANGLYLKQSTDFTLALNATCKLHAQKVALEKLQSSESAVATMKLFTEMNLKDSCNWLNTTYREAQGGDKSYPLRCEQSDLSSLCNGWIQKVSGLIKSANTTTTAYIKVIPDLTEQATEPTNLMDWLNCKVSTSLQAVITPHLTQ